MYLEKRSVLYQLIVYSNLWVGLAVGAFAMLTMSSFWQLNLVFMGFIIFSTTFSYNYMRLIQYATSVPPPARQKPASGSDHLLTLFVMVLFSGVLSALFFIRIFEWRLVWIMVLPALISFTYPLTFRNAFGQFTSLRMVPGLKVFLISFTWSFVTVVVPVFLYDEMDLRTILEFLMRMFLMIALIIPFDIRDLKKDNPDMQTLPQLMGLRKSKELALFFLLLYQVWLVLEYLFFHTSLTYSISLLIGVEIGYWLIRYAHENQKESYFTFWIEAVPIFSGLLLVILHILI